MAITSHEESYKINYDYGLTNNVSIHMSIIFCCGAHCRCLPTDNKLLNNALTEMEENYTEVTF